MKVDGKIIEGLPINDTLDKLARFVSHNPDLFDTTAAKVMYASGDSLTFEQCRRMFPNPLSYP
ncbi:hypothetical protein [Mesorhizobium sp.]|uniref:hypothetical protein n=1 Tax=Mesorhizobium sp. TaxID=1871066 RepID=UPI000FE9DB63|nr:hypothetical protein [Mesorhizobium sp.]RWP62215.1 MAG: hypothetical protein EOR08_15955 [Mesorhizobium sp.]